jgi:hypothetical protein
LAAAALLLGASVLCYEATAPAALVGVVAVPWLQGRSWRRPLLTALVVLAPVAAWMIVFFHPAKKAVHVRADLALVVPAHVGWGVFPSGILATVAGTLACAGAALVGVRAARRRHLDEAAALVTAGVAVVVLGTLPFVRYFYAPLGAGDRVNVVAGVGTALLWTGLAVALRRVAGPAVLGGVAAAIAGGMVVAGLQGVSAWHAAGVDCRRLLASAAVRDARPGDDVAIPRPPLRRNVAAFLDVSNVSSAVQRRAGTRLVTAHLAGSAPS